MFKNLKFFKLYIFLILFIIFLNIIFYLIPNFKMLSMNKLNKIPQIKMESILDNDCNPRFFNITKECLNSTQQINMFETIKIVKNQKLIKGFKRSKF